MKDIDPSCLEICLKTFPKTREIPQPYISESKLKVTMSNRVPPKNKRTLIGNTECSTKSQRQESDRRETRQTKPSTSSKVLF